ncbi:MAG: MFS transporter [Actinomycetota bacterium]
MVARRWAGPLVAAYAVTFLTFFDTFAFLPTIGPRAAALGADPVLVGATVGAYSLTNLATNPVAGALLDRLGRRRLLVAGLAIAIAAVLAYPLATTPGALLGVRLLHGVGGGIIVPAVFTLVGDLTGADRRARAMGRTGAAIGLAAIVGPPVAGALAGRLGFVGVTTTVAAVLGIGLALAATRLPDPPRERSTAPGEAPEAVDVGRLARAGVAVFGFTFALGGLTAFLPFRVEALGGSSATTGALLGLFAVVAAGLMLSPVAEQGRATSALRPLATGLALVTVALTLLGLAPTIVLAAVACAIFGAGYAYVFPTAASEASAAAPMGRRGWAFGLFHAAFSLGFVVGPPLAGWVDATAAGPFSIGAVVAVAALLVSAALPHLASRDRAEVD